MTAVAEAARRSLAARPVHPTDPETRPMRRALGRTFQLVGLLILPFGMATELVGRTGEGGLLLIAAGGAFLFYVGYVIQHR